MFFKSYFTNKLNTQIAIKELFKNCYNKEVKIFIYFVSSNYSFQEVTEELYKLIGNSCTLIGCTSSGEISTNKGITKGGISVVAFGDNSMEIETVVLEKITKVPLLYRQEIIKKLKKLSYKEMQNTYDNLTGILLADGLSGAEEKVLSVFNSIFDGNLPLIGGSAGDDLKFKETLLAYNGKIFNDSAIFTMIKTKVKIKIYRENIFESQGIDILITKADEKNRKIIEIDNIPAKTRYAQLLGISKSSLDNYILQNPIGRKIGDSIYISSIASIENENLNMYAQVFENSRAEILKEKNPLETQKETIAKIQNDFKEIYGLFCINCILRSLEFEKKGILDELSKTLKNTSEYGGFVSYGEQYNKQHLNQTLTLLAMGR